MTVTPITNEEIRERGVSSLPTRPTAPAAFGGGGYTAAELKAAFDRLPCLIIERLNLLLEEIRAEGEGSVAAAIPTGLIEGHTLRTLFADIKNGSLAGYLDVGGTTLTEALSAIDERLAELEGGLVNAKDQT